MATDATNTVNSTVEAKPAVVATEPTTQAVSSAPVVETENTGRARFMNLTKSEITIPMLDGMPLKIGIGRFNISEEFEKKYLPRKHVKMMLHKKFIKYV